MTNANEEAWKECEFCLYSIGGICSQYGIEEDCVVCCTGYEERDKS